MTGTSWLIDSQRIASKIKNVSGSMDLSKQKWVVHQWPGLPKGVKFDPSDQELLSHLLAKHDKAGAEPHPFIDEFIPTVEEDDGICYTHPQKLPGLKQDGSVSHFFHRTYKAYNTGTRKRRRINTGDLADVRWHKTGKTKPVMVDGKHLGCKKIMVLYMSTVKGGKPKKTNWVMHQYHLGTGEDEQNGEYVVSKLFFQQQFKPGEKYAEELTTADALETIAAEADLPDLPEPALDEQGEEHISSITNQEVLHNNEHTADREALPYQQFKPGEKNAQELTTADALETIAAEEDLPDLPEPALDEREEDICSITNQEVLHNNEHTADPEALPYQESRNCDITMEEKAAEEDAAYPSSEKPEDGDNPSSQDPKWWDGESQFLLTSQQLAESLPCLDEFLQSQTSGDEQDTIKPKLADYANLPVEDLKQDLEKCHELGLSDADFRLSQIEFSQDSCTAAWAGGNMLD
ncbi:hypothetical protein BRADI_1g43840v3 [Brachypodium distachyon]|uniref:NAC domain-containing protein n=1 Tax=Brachypodium distachyon TaxID=15368 RepID=A0A0Q3H6S9_BRADI|nr:hypothetical protein BRADI_1g43840v3 [Brachypodium distachyon]